MAQVAATRKARASQQVPSCPDSLNTRGVLLGDPRGGGASGVQEQKGSRICIRQHLWRHRQLATTQGGTATGRVCAGCAEGWLRVTRLHRLSCTLPSSLLALRSPILLGQQALLRVTSGHREPVGLNKPLPARGGARPLTSHWTKHIGDPGHNGRADLGIPHVQVGQDGKGYV